jgi:RNA polymerase sigma factor (sigma-70 family)
MAIATLTPLVRYLQSVAPAEPDSALLARFATHGDEAAFAELVRRHGPVVFGVCRRVLRNVHAAEDAFQATFLLLAKKARSLRRPDLLANWLHGVAYRTAAKLRGRLWRQQAHEHAFDESAFVPPCEHDDIGPDLDAAIQNLPSKYRVPLVLCYLQGLTNAEAAERLGCPAKTVATRLARARHRLRSRLAAQGLTVAVSSVLVAATARNACALSAGAAVSSNLLTLVEGVQSAMMWQKVKMSAALVAVAVLIGAGVGRGVYVAGGQDAAGSAPSGPPLIDRNPAPAPQPPRAAADNRIPAFDVTAPEGRSKNFVVRGASAELCTEIANAAEQHRKVLAVAWLGKELPDWKAPCPIQVTVSPGGSASSTVFQFDKSFVVTGMTLNGTKERIMNSMLPHEVTHTVLADHFQRPLPRWADEGAAVLSETASDQDRHRQDVVQILKEGRAIRLAHLFGMTDYPSEVATLFAQGYSVTRFLVERKDRAGYLEFVKTGMRGGWDAAANRCYELADVAEMEKAWLDWLRREHNKPPAAKEEPLSQAVPIDALISVPKGLDVPPAGNGQAVLPPPEPAPLPPTPVAPVQTPPPAPATTDLPPPPATPPPPAPTVSPQPAPLQGPPAIPDPPYRPDNLTPQQTANGYTPVALPIHQPALTVVQASVDKEGLLVCKFPKSVHFQPSTNYVRDGSGSVRSVTSYVKTYTQEERGFRPEQVEVLDTEGKALDAKDWAKRLQKETPVILVQSGTIDVEILKLLKDGTLTVRFPPQAPLPVPPAPSQYTPPPAINR